MSTAAQQPASLPSAPEVKPGVRLASLDAYRGFIMLLLVSHGFGLAVLQHYPGWAWLAGQVDHAAWEGCTFWDLIQPAFTFMVGMAMPFAFARRMAEGATGRDLFRHVAWRAVVLIALSNVSSNWGGRPRPVLQLINVLCQIAFGYVLCFLITRLRFTLQAGIAAAMLAGNWALFVLFPGPGGAFSKTASLRINSSSTALSAAVANRIEIAFIAGSSWGPLTRGRGPDACPCSGSRPGAAPRPRCGRLPYGRTARRHAWRDRHRGSPLCDRDERCATDPPPDAAAPPGARPFSIRNRALSPGKRAAPRAGRPAG
jgi:hypothetical protein